MDARRLHRIFLVVPRWFGTVLAYQQRGFHHPTVLDPQTQQRYLAPMHHYIFDVDHTLYPLGHPFGETLSPTGRQHLMDLTQKSFEHIQEEMALIRQEKRPLIKEVSKRYNISIEDIISYTNNLDYTQLQPDLTLNQLIKELVGIKHVYTDGVKNHAEKAVHALGLEGTFEHLFGVEIGEYYYKDSVADFSHILTSISAEGKNCTFVEDKAANLKPAKASGMRTILLTNSDENIPEWVDETAPNLPTWLRSKLARV